MILGDQLVRGVGIFDDALDLLGDEVAPLGIRGVIEQYVGVVARQLREARAVPHLLEERPSLFFRILEGGAIVRGMVEPARRRVQYLAQRFEVSPELHQLVRYDRRVVERWAPAGTALVHRERGKLVSDDRNPLPASRTRPDVR